MTDDESEMIRGDLRWGTIPALLRDAAVNHAGEPALIDGDVRFTYAELSTAVDNAAKAFIGAGLQPGGARRGDVLDVGKLLGQGF